MFNFSSDNVCCECGKPAEMGVCEGCQIGSMDNFFQAVSIQDEPPYIYKVSLSNYVLDKKMNISENNLASEKKVIDYINDSYNQAGGK